MAMSLPPINLNKFVSKIQFSTKLNLREHVRCAPMQQQLVREDEDDQGIMCEPCNGKGWLLCDFCNGQKINVKAANNRIYRRCPSCRAIGCILCTKCKVFKCVTFPNYTDGENLSF